jgi:hypothetical protein
MIIYLDLIFIITSLLLKFMKNIQDMKMKEQENSYHPNFITRTKMLGVSKWSMHSMGTIRQEPILHYLRSIIT